jgi:hypothetical protein
MPFRLRLQGITLQKPPESVQKSVSKEKFNNNITFDIWKKRKKAIEHDWKI